jgi:HEAT repeats
MLRREKTKRGKKTSNEDVSRLGREGDLQRAREYARQDLPGLLALCARLVREFPADPVEPYAQAIAEEASAAKTIHNVVRALAIDDEAAMRSFAAQVLQYCPPGDEVLLGVAQWLATDREGVVTGAAFKALRQWFQPQNPIHKLALDMLNSQSHRSEQAATLILSNATVESGAAEALRAVLAIKDESSRAAALAGLAPRLPESLVAEALRAVLAIQNESGRAQALVWLAPRLSESMMAEALRAVLAIPYEPGRAQALGELAPHLPESMMAEALRAVLAIKDAYGRAQALAGLAPHLPEPLRWETLLHALKDEHTAVRQSAARILGQLGDARAVEVLLETLDDQEAIVRQSAAEALGRLGRGNVRLFSQLEELSEAENLDLRYGACLALKPLIATSPDRALHVAEGNLRQAWPDSDQRFLFMEMIGRCAFLGIEAAAQTVQVWSKSRATFERVASAALLGELLPLKPEPALRVFNQLARDEDWAVREAVALPLARRSLFCPKAAVEPLRTLGEDEEIAVLVAASAALGQSTWDREAFSRQPRLRRYTRLARRSPAFERLLGAIQETGGGGFAPFPSIRRPFDLGIIEDLLTEGSSQAEEEGSSRVPGEQKWPRPGRQQLRPDELQRFLREFGGELFGSERVQQLEPLERLLQLLPDPLIFYVIYKQAPDALSRSVFRLFYELASLVEKVESAELFKGREEAWLRRQLPQALERLAHGFGALQQFDQDQEYAVLFSSLRHLLMASSLSQILTALAAAERELRFPRRQRSKIWGEDSLRPLFARLRDAVRPLRQYSEEAPLSLRTLPLSETISHLEEVTRFVGIEGAEPYRTILLQILAGWRDLVRFEIRRLEGEAKLEFSTLEEVMAGEVVTVVLEIRNRGPAPASNLRVQLRSKGLVDVQPDLHALPSLAINETKTLSFTVRPRGGRGKKFPVEFVIVYDDLLAKANEQRYTASVALRALTRPWKYIRNPYLPGKPDPDLKEVERLFVGRDDVLRFIKENLVGAAAERTVVLYGHRRTGKTWTLLRVQERIPATYLPVYINVQEFTGVSGVPAVLQIFADEVLRTVEERCALSQRALAAIRVPTFEQYQENYPYYFKRVFLRDIQEVIGERKLLWLFDEFQGLDDMVTSGNLPATFMEFLRDLMQFGRKMAFIFAGTREMTGQYWSVFFNIAVQRKIGVLNDADAAKLIVNPVKSLGVEHDRFAVPFTKQLPGNHPYFIQLLCDRIVSKLNEREQMLVNAQIIEAAVDDMVINGASNLKFYWAEVMDEQERAIAATMRELLRRKQPTDVRTIANEMSEFNPHITVDDVSSALRSLAEKDLLEKDKRALDTYKFKIGLLQSYITAHISYAETQERSYRVLQRKI